MLKKQERNEQMFGLFKKKTQKEKEIVKLEHQLFKYKQKRDFLMPEVKRTLFRKKLKTESISNNRVNRVVKCNRKILNLEDKLNNLYKGEE